ncbi:MAG: cytochrome c-type biogenesis protein CcmH [Pseudomonadota bacterium]|nr:cytochrome c-type biogenesis protein CcmH [Pseudomonadota bacterium]
MRRASVIALVLASAAWSVSAAPEASPPPHEAANSSADPALEARVMAVAEELRCLVCQNETIAASHADLAVDLRKQIRIKLSEGQSERQILDFMVERYGDFVLYRPTLQATTVLLWVGPFALLLVAGFALARAIRGRQRQLAVPLSPTDAARARQLLEESSPGS